MINIINRLELKRTFTSEMLSITVAFSRLLRTTCPKCYRYQNYATRKRFFKGTSVVQSDSKWEVTLDHRRLKTPNGKVLAVNSEPLARAIAAEWDSQTEHITPPTMHLTALCNTAMDNPGKLTSHDIASYLLDYFATDTLLFHSEDDIELKNLQDKKWTPAIEWFEKRFNVSQEVATGLLPPPVTTETRAILGRYFLSYNFAALSDRTVVANKPDIVLIDRSQRRAMIVDITIPHDENLVKAEMDKRVKYLVLAHEIVDMWDVDSAIIIPLGPKAMTFGVEALKSPILMLACIERHVEPKQAVWLSRLEEEYQSARWGRVAWSHELNQEEMTSRVAASLLVIHSSVEKHSTKAKVKAEEQRQ